VIHASCAQASIIAADDEYDIYVSDTDFSNTRNSATTFDGIDEAFGELTLSESITNVAFNQYLLNFSIRSAQDIYSDVGSAYFGIGVLNPLGFEGVY
jgi:Tol biopolymer transport system component